jgi:hypothetical protein
VTYRGRGSTSCNQSVWLYDWSYGTWSRLDAHTVGTTEIEVSVQAGGTLASWVSGSAGDGEVAVRIRCTRGDSTSFWTSGDLLRVTYEK